MWVDPATLFEDLLNDGRIEEAEALLADYLEGDPHAASIHALRALLLKDLRREDEALEVARYAISLNPHDGFAQWVMGALLEARQRYAEALTFATTARDHQPQDPKTWALIGQIHVAQGRWQSAIEALDQALLLDPGDEVALSLRALCARYVDSGEPWNTHLEALLDRWPASAWARAGQGWAALEQGAAGEAREHFEQAYTLDPTSEWTRAGLAESLKAGNPAYRQILRVLLWFDRQPPKVRWGIILGGIVGYRYLRQASEAMPGLRLVAYPLMAAWVVFILASWLAGPLSDFVLSLDRTGRRLLTSDQRMGGSWVVAILAAAIAMALGALVTGGDDLYMAAFLIAFLVIPVAAIYQCDPGWPRATMTAYTATAGLAVPVVIAAPEPAAGIAFVLGLLMAVAGSWLGVFLSSRRVAR